MSGLTSVVKPDFIIIGAQKCGTTWLWDMLKQHPGTDLRNPKEIQYFSSSENLQRGSEWYYQHFSRVDPQKLNGEASTDYFFDRVLINNLLPDEEYPLIPELIQKEIPEVKIICILRDPIRRAVSAYYHHLQSRRYPPGTGLFEAAEKYPHLRIIERGFYARYLKVWLDIFSMDNMLCLIFEKHVLGSPERTHKMLYSYLGLDPNYYPVRRRQSARKRWGWTHIWLNYYLGSWYGLIYRQLRKTFLSALLAKIDDLKLVSGYRIPDEDLTRLEEVYCDQRAAVEDLLKINLAEWED